MLKERLISGGLLAGVMLVTIVFATQPVVAVMLGVIFTIGAWEWMGLTKYATPLLRLIFAAVIAGFFLLGWLFREHGLTSLWLILAVITWFLILVLLSFYHRAEANAEPRWQLMLLLSGLLLLPAAWLALVKLDGMHPGWLVYALALSGIADSFAYLAGKQFGKHKLAPELSPGKTKEGLFGGLLAVLVFTLVVALVIKLPMIQMVSLVLLSLICGLVSVVGDLFVSMMKRESGLKDTGKILPGHGGILDRFDSHIAVAPVLFLGLRWIL
ncbi:MAG TPA: phosphatidate cytidylyltransferase [Chromatiales bacterium]|nr:phosphatidate cytidylyltransferase [Thiotrichales bacterium]HIP67128.1 phosphatidate cytidylyltransferase [Chromatiales bacterium]